MRVFAQSNSISVEESLRKDVVVIAGVSPVSTYCALTRDEARTAVRGLLAFLRSTEAQPPDQPTHDFKKLERMLLEEKNRCFHINIDFDKADVMDIVKRWLAGA